MTYAFPPPPVTAVPILGSDALFPIHRIYCVGRNYADHAMEMGFTGREPPFFFMKPADALVVVPESMIGSLPYPALTQDFQHEIELVVAIGKGGVNIPVDQAMSHVFGYTVGLDMTRRDIQADLKKQGRPWCISKGFDNSAPIGPIVPADRAGAIERADIALTVNDAVRQNSNISKLIWTIAETISQLSAGWTLQPGDLIYSGTPEGVAAVSRSDLLTGTITGLPPLSVRVS